METPLTVYLPYGRHAVQITRVEVGYASGSGHRYWRLTFANAQGQSSAHLFDSDSGLEMVERLLAAVGLPLATNREILPELLLGRFVEIKVVGQESRQPRWRGRVFQVAGDYFPDFAEGQSTPYTRLHEPTSWFPCIWIGTVLPDPKLARRTHALGGPQGECIGLEGKFLPILECQDYPIRHRLVQFTYVHNEVNGWQDWAAAQQDLLAVMPWASADRELEPREAFIPLAMTEAWFYWLKEAFSLPYAHLPELVRQWEAGPPKCAFLYRNPPLTATFNLVLSKETLPDEDPSLKSN